MLDPVLEIQYILIRIEVMCCLRVPKVHFEASSNFLILSMLGFFVNTKLGTDFVRSGRFGRARLERV